MPPTSEGRRVGIKFPNGNVLYYDIDADGAVYWLRPRKGKIQRYRVREAKLAEWVREQAANEQAKTQPDVDSSL